MKKYLLYLAMLVIVAATSCQEKIDYDKEKEAVIKVIEEETDAFLHKDYQRWADTYVRDGNNFRLSADTYGYDFVCGWEELNEYYREWFADTTSQGITWLGEKSNYCIRVYGESAWAVFDQKAINPETGEEGEWKSREVRFLEKVDKKWKITFLSLVVTSSYDNEVPLAESEIRGADNE